MYVDKKENPINLYEKVEAEVGAGLFDSIDPVLATKTVVLAIVIELLPDGKIKCVPVEQGCPFIIETKYVEVVDPLIAELINAISDDEVTKLIEEAYTRLKTEQTVKRSKKSSSGGGTTKVNLAAGIKM